jgi:next-to-BRCA1 protein 1
VFERYSDSAGTFVTLDPENTPVYKQLFRAAKAKLKLRIKATIVTQQEGKLTVYPASKVKFRKVD